MWTKSYTASISREFSLSYFDHPPLHQWIVYALEGVLGSGTLLRLPFIALSGVASWLMFLFTRQLFGAGAGVWATLGLNIAGFFTAVAGSWILPDGPLDVSLLGAALALATILFPATSTAAGAPWRNWLIVGLCLGTAGLSKYQAVLFGIGLALFIATSPGRWRIFLHPAPVVAAGLALLIISPVFVWNSRNGWVSFVFQGARGAVSHGARPLPMAVALLGQAGLLLPWVFAPLALSALRAGPAGWRDSRRWLCLMLAAPAIVVFSLTPLWGKPALPHWSMSGWLMLFPLLGEWLARSAADHHWPRRWAALSTAATLALWALFAGASAGAWAKALVPSLGKDPTVKSAPWTHLRQAVVARRRAGRGCLFLAALNWREGGKIGAVAGDLAPVRVLSADPRGFGFLKRPPNLTGCDALVIGQPRALASRAADITGLFASVRPFAVDHEGRRGRDEIEVSVLDARGLKSPLPPPYGLPADDVGAARAAGPVSAAPIRSGGRPGLR